MNHVKFAPKVIECRNYKDYDKELLCERLRNSNWSGVYNTNDVNTAWANMKTTILSCFDALAPKITKRIKGKPCPWLTADIKENMNKRDRLFRKSRRTKNFSDIKNYKTKRNEVSYLVRHAKQTYYKKLLKESANNPDSFWSTIKKLYPSKPKSQPLQIFDINSTKTSNPLLISNTFFSYFSNAVSCLEKKSFSIRDCIWIPQTKSYLRTTHNFKFSVVCVDEVKIELKRLNRKKSTGLDGIPPHLLKDCAAIIANPLTHIINNSLGTSVYPTDWKYSKLLPFYKSASRSDIKNYRPISVIPAISKIIEKIVHKQLSSYLEPNLLLNKAQFGFRKERSTELAAKLFVDNIKRKVNDGKLVGAVFIDLSKAFDTLSHGKLINKLESYGISGVELIWFKDYLFNRSQTVSHKECLSDVGKVTSGVPQGSIIGPLLFTIFFNDFPECLKHSEVVIYADDTVIYVPGMDPFIIETRLSADMESISKWCVDNELILNFNRGKTESMMFGTAKRLAKQSTLTVMFGFQQVNFTTFYKYLGIHIDPSLNMSTNFTKTLKKASGRLRFLHKIRPFLNLTHAKLIYQSMVLPTLTWYS